MRPTPALLLRRVSLPIALSSTVADVRAVTKYSPIQWAIFNVQCCHFHPSFSYSLQPQTATASVAQARYGDHDETHTAVELSSSEKLVLEHQVNKMLRKHGVTEMPGQDVLYWRWHRVFKNMRRTKAGTCTCPSCRREAC